MATKSNVIPALVHGVSQQDNDLRLPGHAEAMTNWLCDPSEGTTYRPPLEYVADTLVSTDKPYCLPHAVTTTDGKEWGFTMQDGKVTAWFLDTGIGQTLTNTYLNTTGDSRDNLRATKVGDGIVVVNRETVPAKDSSSVATGEQGYLDKLITVDTAFNGTTYDIRLSHPTAAAQNITFTAGSADTTATIAAGLFDSISSWTRADFVPPLLAGTYVGLTITYTTYGVTTIITGSHTVVGGDTYASIAQGVADSFAEQYPNTAIVKAVGSTGGSSYLDLYLYETANVSYATISTSIGEAAGSPGLSLTLTPTYTNYVAFLSGGQIRVLNRIRTLDGGNVEAIVSDTLGNTAMSLLPPVVSSIEVDPPVLAYDGAYITEQASSVDGNTLYFVYDVSSNEEPLSHIGTGTWIETALIGQETSWDASTMPHLLSYNPATSMWSFGVAPWTAREVGDDTSVPFVDFNGQGITAIFTFQSRLGLLYGNKWAFSKADDPYNLFRESASQVADDDPIVGFSTSGNTGLLFAAEEANQNLVLFGTSRSLAITGSLALTPTTINPASIATTALNIKVDPQLKGTNIMAISAGDTYNNVYMLQSVGDYYKSSHISGHVDHYIPDCSYFSIAEERNISVMGNDTEVVVHQWELGSEGFNQNAFHKWSLPDEWVVYNAFWNRDKLYLVVSDGASNPQRLCKADCSRGYFIDTINRSDFEILPATKSYDGVANETTLTTSRAVYGVPLVYVTAKTTDIPVGHLAYVKSYSTLGSITTIVLQGDYSAETLAIGSEYTPSVTLSKLSARDGRGIPYDDGRVQLKYMWAHFNDCGYLRATVSSPGKEDRQVEADQQFLSFGASAVDTIFIIDGKLKVPIRAANNKATITIDAPGNLPCTLTWHEWEYSLKVRSRRG